MALEIERKFLVDKTLWEKNKPSEGVTISQGYLVNEKEKSVRVRVKGNQAYLTIKGETKYITRSEFEYAIPLEEANELLSLFCPQRIEKRRYTLRYEGHLWEVDEFFQPQGGLILAEIELSSEEEVFAKPIWLGKEVSGEEKYYNANMVK